MTTKDRTIRVPDAWVGQFNSAEVSAWLADFLRRPAPLPPDPGPGDGRTTLTLDRRAVNVLAAAVEASPSAALRRLIQFRISAPLVQPIRNQPEETSTALVPIQRAPLDYPIRDQQHEDALAAGYWRAQRAWNGFPGTLPLGMVRQPRTAPLIASGTLEQTAARLERVRDVGFVLFLAGAVALLFLVRGGGSSTAAVAIPGAAPAPVPPAAAEFAAWRPLA